MENQEEQGHYMQVLLIILYPLIGPHPSIPNLIAHYKLVELFRGKYFLEENLFNLNLNSVKSTLVSLDKSHFHKNVSAEKILFDRRFHPDPNIITGYSYIRQIKDTNKIFKNAFTVNHREDYNKISSIPCNAYRKWVINNYLSRRV
jgi:hypothetical protein